MNKIYLPKQYKEKPKNTKVKLGNTKLKPKIIDRKKTDFNSVKLINGRHKEKIKDTKLTKTEQFIREETGAIEIP
eukprot:UN16565